MSRSTGGAAQALIRKADLVDREVRQFVADRGRLGVVEAPPGSGKTTLLLKAADSAWRLRRRVAVATQTNSQADDICKRFAKGYPQVPVVRFASSSSSEYSLGASVRWVKHTADLPHGPCVVVGTSAKWGMVDLTEPFDVLFVEEAWQLAWADFMLLGQVAERFVLVGDPGQIDPVVSVNVARWETSPRAPHRPAPVIILEDGALRAERWNLPATRRLPYDTLSLIRSFYDFQFGATAAPGERSLVCSTGGGTPGDRAIAAFREGSAVAMTIPTPDEGPPLEGDPVLAGEAVKFVKRLLDREANLRMGRDVRPLAPQDIGLCATHRVMNSELQLALPDRLRGKVVVDTPERWQGLERPVMVMVHPLSSVIRPSEFDLTTGRLCVMASRHQVALAVLSRDHVGPTLEAYIPSAEQPVGRPDITGHGLFSHQAFWRALEDRGNVVAA
jgi:hypothetical protein